MIAQEVKTKHWRISANAMLPDEAIAAADCGTWALAWLVQGSFSRVMIDGTDIPVSEITTYPNDCTGFVGKKAGASGADNFSFTPLDGIREGYTADNLVVESETVIPWIGLTNLFSTDAIVVRGVAFSPHTLIRIETPGDIVITGSNARVLKFQI